MGILLKLAIAAVAGYIFWGVVRKVLANLLGTQAPPAPLQPKPQPLQQRRTVEETKQCAVCGSYVALSAAKCRRQDCPQPA